MMPTARELGVHASLLIVLLITSAAGVDPNAPASNDVLVSRGLGSAAYSGSGVYSGYKPGFAFDPGAYRWPGYWNSGDYPVQWIEVDLQRNQFLTRVRLVVAQLPDGETTHEVWASDRPIRSDLTRARLIGTFDGLTHDRDVLELRLSSSPPARYVQVRTVRSPSWVAWMEVQVFAAPSS